MHNARGNDRSYEERGACSMVVLRLKRMLDERHLERWGLPAR